MKEQDIEKRLREALLHNGKMAYNLYEEELEENVGIWYEGMEADQDEFVFVITENSGLVAMLLIQKDKIIYINEEAREKLRELWLQSYEKNLEQLLPMIAEELADGELMINGIKFSKDQ